MPRRAEHNTITTVTGLLPLLFLFLVPLPVTAQGSAGSGSTLELRRLVDLPTAGILPEGAIAFDVDFYQPDGMTAGFTAGVLGRITLGLSYGGAEIIGTQPPQWNKAPGIDLRIRVIDETMLLPALTLGFDTQGKEEYLTDDHRYRIKSPGFFLVGSKNYTAMGFLSFHGGITYSLEHGDGDRDPDAFVGVEKTLGPIMSAVGEYDLGINDQHADALGRGRGYLNIGLRASLGRGFTFSLNFKDFLHNQDHVSAASRSVHLEYVALF